MNRRIDRVLIIGSSVSMLVALLALPSADASYKGRVLKHDGSRVSRPTSEDVEQNEPFAAAGANKMPAPAPLVGQTSTQAPVNGALADDSFVLKAETSSGAVQLEGWNPWQGIAIRTAGPQPLFRAQTIRAPQLPLQVDYENIECAYEAAVPRCEPPRRTATALGEIPPPSAAMLAQMAAVAALNARTGAQPAGGCVSAPTAPVAPTVLPSGVAIPAGAGFSIRSR